MRKWKQDPGWVKKNEGDLDTRIRNMLSTWKVNSQGGTAGDHSPSPAGVGVRWWQGQLAVIATVWQEWTVYQDFHQEQCTCYHGFQRGGILKSTEEKREGKEIQRISFLSYMPLKREVSDTQCKQVTLRRIKKTTPFLYFWAELCSAQILVQDFSSLTRDRTFAPAMEAQSPKHCTAGEAPLTGFSTASSTPWEGLDPQN